MRAFHRNKLKLRTNNLPCKTKLEDEKVNLIRKINALKKKKKNEYKSKEGATKGIHRMNGCG